MKSNDDASIRQFFQRLHDDHDNYILHRSRLLNILRKRGVDTANLETVGPRDLLLRLEVPIDRWETATWPEVEAYALAGAQRQTMVAPRDAKPKAARDTEQQRTEKVLRAISIKAINLARPNRDIAREVGLSASTLSRNPKWHATIGRLEAMGKGDLRSGIKTRDGRVDCEDDSATDLQREDE